jgi:hypothetical protein
MPRLSPLNELLDEDLTVPLRSTAHPDGKDYVIPAPDAETGLWLQEQARIGAQIYEGLREATEGDLDDMEEKSFYRKIMGPAFDEMIADGVKWPSIKRAGSAIMAWALSDADDAEDVWSGKAKEEAKANRAERRAKKKTKARASGSKR